MAAFSHHNQDPASFFLDQTVFFPNPNTTSLPQFHHNSFNGHHHHHHDQANSAVTNKLQSPDSSMSMVLDEHKAENGNDQLAKKRKDKQLVSHHAQSKDTSNKIKKQKKIGDHDQEDKRKKKPKKDSSEEDEAVGYIHVRARRGQATDSHSLAERVRREKISERMKLLQAIVPGCDKVTGKALMLDEIINYVQSLQNQVEFLSMKLASVNPMLYDFGDGLDSFMLKPDENMSTMVLPIMPSVQQNLSNGGITFVPTNNNYNNYLPQLMDHGSAVTSSLLFQQYSQGNGDQLWDVDEQRLKFDNGFVLSDNSASFQ